MTIASHIVKRAIEEAKFIVKKNATIRSTANHFGVSKSTIHRDIKKVLEEADSILYQRVQDIIQKNKAERHIRGGEATKKKNQLIAKEDSKKKSNLRQISETSYRRKAI